MANQAGAHYRIPAAEAAARLGVKRESLYAYVSRGLLSRRVGEDGRSSLFDLAEVEALVGRRGRRPSSSTIDVTIVSGITRIADDGVWYRGRPLAGLVADSSFEQVAQLLWTGVDELRGVHEVQSDWATHRLLVPPTGGHPADALLQLVIASARGDGTRGALEAAPVTAAGRRMIAAFVDHRPCDTPRRPQNRSLAARFAARLDRPLENGLDHDAFVKLIDATMVILADHEIPASTLAARIAASTRADPYAVVATGLGVLAGPLHGGASAPAAELIALVQETGDAPAALLAWRQAGRGLFPGFGHKVYRGIDPRAALLLRLLQEVVPPERLAAAVALRDAVRAAHRVEPNVDWAIGAFLCAAGLDRNIGEWLFAVARTAGWLAHALEEYREAPVRFRPRSIYSGVR